MANHPIFTAADLLSGGAAFQSLTPPAKLSVFGDPVAHSKSPEFHNAALEASGIDAQYVAIHVRPEELADALRALPAAGFFGTNLTIPHKSAALEIMDSVDPAARAIGAVNTIVVESDQLAGFNTDGPGLVRAIREEFSVDIRDLRVMVFGAGGGAGRAICVQCALEGCERLVMVNRTFDKVAALKKELAAYFRSDRLVGPIDRLEAIPHEDSAIRTQLEHVDLIINATSIGMKRTDPALLSSSFLTPNLMVYDTVYALGKSRLIEDAESAGARAANGLSMLLHQGALSFEIWFNQTAPIEAMRQALRGV